jgi:recF protein
VVMIIERLSILNFKNIEEANLDFSPKMNYLFGNNGMGKTNLLDALYYLSFCKSHSNLPDHQLMRYNADFCMLQGFYRENGTEEEIYCGIRRNQRKVFKRNKKEYERLSDHIGLVPLVMISPEDTELIQGGSEGRRKFVDLLISQYDKEYLNELIRYNRVLGQRNSLLKESLKFSEDSLFDILDEQLSYSGEIIHKKRKDFLKSYLPVFQKYHQSICNDSDSVGLNYDSQLNNFPLDQLLTDRREKDKIVGYTSAGIHKDDFIFLLDSHLIRKVGSQGQSKTYLIALKLAQFSFLVQQGLSTPLLLLDDIFDKLDATRVEQIVQLVSRSEFGQIFITDTNRKYLDNILKKTDQDYKLFQVEQGKIEELK